MTLFKSKEDKPKKADKPVPSIEPKTPAEIKTVQTFPSEMPSNFQIPKISEVEDIPEKFPAQTREITSPRKDLDEPFFVRIDKFKESKENLNNISSRLEEVEKIMATFEEVKKREDEEIREFKEQTREIKDFLLKIDQNIFNKL